MQTEMNKLFAEGGVMQEGGTVDPVSGNDVPPGAMQEEVRDDIDAKLSEGEFVFPADVVRFYGLEKLMMMRDKAKKGLERMNEIGQMGNAEEVEDGEALYGEEEEMDDETFSSEIDSIMGEEGGEEEREYADGGYVVPENQELYRDAPIKGFEMVPMTNDAGQTIYIPFINGVAQLSIPAGYKVKKAGDTGTTPTTETTPTTSGGDTGGGYGDGGSGGGGSGGGSNTDGSAKGGGQGVSNSSISAGLAAMAFGESLAGKAVSAILGVPASTIAGLLGKAGLDAQLDALGKADAALSQDTLGGQLGLVSDQSGNISTVSNQSITDAFDMATFGTTSSQMSAEAASTAQGLAAADAVGAEGPGVGNIGSLGFGTTGTDTGTDGVSSGNTGGLGFGTSGTDTGTDGTGAGTGDGGGGGVGAGDGGGGIGAGEGLAKGGLVSKPKKSNSKGLAGRRK